jgi:hypothetical protein
MSPRTYWPLDGGSGAASAGTAVLNLDGGAAQPSPLGGGASFGTATALFPRSLSMSVAAWVKFPSSGSFSSAGLVSMPAWGWTLNGDGQGGSFVMQTEYDWANGGFGLPYSLHDDRWHHLVVMNDSGPGFNNYSWCRVYLDGQYVTQFPMTYSGPPPTTVRTISPSRCRLRMGLACSTELAASNRALNADEVARLYFGTTRCPTPPMTELGQATMGLGPLAYWSLDRASQAPWRMTPYLAHVVLAVVSRV